MKFIILILCFLSIPTYLVARADRDLPTTNQPTTVPPIVLQGQLNQQLSDAILASNIDSLKKAISDGADVNYIDSDGKTPVWLALILGNFEAVLALLESGAKSDVAYKNKSFAQIFFDEASISDVLHIKILRLLVTNRVDFNNITKNIGGGTIVDFTVQALDKSVNDPNLKNVSLKLAQDIQQFTNVRSVYPYQGYNSISQELWLTGNCYFYSDLAVIDMCIKAGMDINKSKVLYIRRARIDDKNFSNVGLSFYNSRLRSIGENHHPQYQPLKPMPALFIAIKTNSKRDMDVFDPQYSSKAIETLLDRGADINLVENPDGTGQQTPLDWALANGSSDAIRILTKRGAKTYKQLQNQ